MSEDDEKGLMVRAMRGEVSWFDVAVATIPFSFAGIALIYASPIAAFLGAMSVAFMSITASSLRRDKWQSVIKFIHLADELYEEMQEKIDREYLESREFRDLLEKLIKSSADAKNDEELDLILRILRGALVNRGDGDVNNYADIILSLSEPEARLLQCVWSRYKVEPYMEINFVEGKDRGQADPEERKTAMAHWEEIIHDLFDEEKSGLGRYQRLKRIVQPYSRGLVSKGLLEDINSHHFCMLSIPAVAIMAFVDQKTYNESTGTMVDLVEGEDVYTIYQMLGFKSGI